MHWAKVCSRELLRVMFGVRVNVFVNAGKGVYVCVCSDNFCLLFFFFYGSLTKLSGMECNIIK